jgi:hypothetical protein
MKEILIKIALCILLLSCLIKFPYGYYQLIRFIAMAGFGILAFDQYHINKTWFQTWLYSAILINPIFKIALGRGIWNVLDVFWAILLIISIFTNKSKMKRILLVSKKNIRLMKSLFMKLIQLY